MTVDARTFTLPPAAAREIEALAERYGQPADELLAEAVRRYVDEEHAFIERVEAAQANVDAGHTVPWDEAMRHLRGTIVQTAARRRAG